MKKYSLISRLHSKKSNLKKKSFWHFFLSLPYDCRSMKIACSTSLDSYWKKCQSLSNLFSMTLFFYLSRFRTKLKRIQLFRPDNSRILLPLFCLFFNFFWCVKLLISSIVLKAPLYDICLDSSIGLHFLWISRDVFS